MRVTPTYSDQSQRQGPVWPMHRAAMPSKLSHSLGSNRGHCPQRPCLSHPTPQHHHWLLVTLPRTTSPRWHPESDPSWNPEFTQNHSHAGENTQICLTKMEEKCKPQMATSSGFCVHTVNLMGDQGVRDRSWGNVQAGAAAF